MSRNFESTNRWVSKRNFQNYMITWLGGLLGVGPALGEVFFVASSSSQYYDWLLNCGVKSDRIVDTLYEGEALMTADQNDVLCVCPGTYTETVETDWDKRYTHIVGLGGPNIRGYDTYGTQFYTSTVTVARIIEVTGQRCQFHNVTFANNGANATCLSAMYINAYGIRLKNCQIIGMMASTQCDTTKANSLNLGPYASYLDAEDCIIGTSEWATQGSDTNAPLYFSSASGGTMPQEGRFTRCSFRTQIAAATRPIVYAERTGIGRDWVFDRCEFYAFASAHSVACTQAFQRASGSPMTNDVVFKDCVGYNVTAFMSSADGCTWASGGGAAAAKTGIAIAATAT